MASFWIRPEYVVDYRPILDAPVDAAGEVVAVPNFVHIGERGGEQHVRESRSEPDSLGGVSLLVHGAAPELLGSGLRSGSGSGFG